VTTSESVWLEVALNGAAGRAFQPGIPITEQEIVEQAIACVDEGAAIVHLHVYNNDQQPVEDADIYSKVFEQIKRQRDVILYPTLSLTGTVEERLAPIKILAARGLLEWGVVDPGSVNITHRSQLGPDVQGLLYANPDDHIKAGLALAAQNQWRPAFAIYEPGFARLGAALAEQQEDLLSPIYRVMFSENLLFGMPPTENGLRFYAQHLADCAGSAPWMISGLDADLESIMPAALELGAHIRVGLEDAPFGCEKPNVELVQLARAAIEHSGRGLATVEQIRCAP
jgi:uncharacterized protein (DUF849 family)